MTEQKQPLGLKAISVNAARALGQKSGARQVVILSLDGEDYCITTWGKTREECRALADWAESRKATAVIRQIAEGSLRSAVLSTALDPDCKSDIGVE